MHVTAESSAFERFVLLILYYGTANEWIQEKRSSNLAVDCYRNHNIRANEYVLDE